MATVEDFRLKYQLNSGETDILEGLLEGDESVAEIGFSAIERLKEEAREAGMKFVAAAILPRGALRLYFRQGYIPLFRDLHFSGNPAITIFRDAASHGMRLHHGLGPSPSN